MLEKGKRAENRIEYSMLERKRMASPTLYMRRS